MQWGINKLLSLLILYLAPQVTIDHLLLLPLRAHFHCVHFGATINFMSLNKGCHLLDLRDRQCDHVTDRWPESHAKMAELSMPLETTYLFSIPILTVCWFKSPRSRELTIFWCFILKYANKYFCVFFKYFAEFNRLIILVPKCNFYGFGCLLELLYILR